jgi:hypothetical protein
MRSGIRLRGSTNEGADLKLNCSHTSSSLAGQVVFECSSLHPFADLTAPLLCKDLC